MTGTAGRCGLPFLDVTGGLAAGRGGALLVDNRCHALTEAAAIDAGVRQVTGRRVTHVVLTHKHFDHAQGSSVLADAETYCALRDCSVEDGLDAGCSQAG